jgi:nucleotide-binding universal stress UspA family protein
VSLKDLVVHVDPTERGEVRAELAGALGWRHGAHVIGLHVIEPLPSAGYFPADIGLYAGGEALHELIRQRAIEAADQAERRFREPLRRHGVNGEWRVTQGGIAAQLAYQARCVDLVIVGQLDPDRPPFGSAVPPPEQIVLSSGRPVLVVPNAARFQGIGDRVLVAWNGGREAARAVNDALPFLVKASSVTVLTVNPEVARAEAPAVDIIRHLARHGVRADATHKLAADIGVGDALLNHATELPTDLVVMGAYGYSCLRELVLGGATRSVLRHMTVPVLMSH